MKAWKVNADYENVLFSGKSAPQMVNQSLEFLFLWLEKEPLLTQKDYSEDYLQYLKEFSGHKPQLISTGEAKNWWGSLTDISREKLLNSKEIVLEFDADAFLYTKGEAFRKIDEKKMYLAKNLHGMSGTGHLPLAGSEISGLSGSWIIEPLYQRRFDFSTYVLTDQLLTYENSVNEKFQYKGSIFHDLKEPGVEALSFYTRVSKDEWERFLQRRKEIVQLLNERYGVQGGYSIDSFVYEEKGELRIRAVCEINYRKTMGYISWLLARKFAGDNSWSALLLGKKRPGGATHQDWVERLTSIHWRAETKSGIILLSPGDTRFELFLIMAKNEDQGREYLTELKRLLPDCEFSI